MEQLLRHTVSNDWMTLVVLSSMLLLALAKHISSVRFAEFLQLVVTDKYFYMQGKDTRLFSMFNVFLFLFQSLSFGILLYLLGKTFFAETLAELRFPFLTIVVGYSVFTLLKIAIEKGIGMMFSIEKVLTLYTYQKVSYRNWLSLIVFACNVHCHALSCALSACSFACVARVVRACWARCHAVHASFVHVARVVSCVARCPRAIFVGDHN